MSAVRSVTSEVMLDLSLAEEFDIDPSWLGEVAYGEVRFEDGACTGATPGKLLRHGRG